MTKYTGPANTENGSYLDNLPAYYGGIYKVFGTGAQGSSIPVRDCSNCGTMLQQGGATYGSAQGPTNNLHYIELNVTEFSELWLNGSQDPAALPVNMLYLQADGIDNQYIVVSWATAQEINNNHFTIERSADLQNWDSIGIVLGHGTITTESDYTFNDNEVAANINYYYRLKQVDDNGNFTYTDVVTAKIYGQATFNIRGFIPNPTNGSTSLIINTSVAADVSVQIFNMLGQDDNSYPKSPSACGCQST